MYYSKRFLIYNIEDAPGKGCVERYRLFGGLDAVSCDIHMDGYTEDIPAGAMICGYCREGRVELEYADKCLAVGIGETFFYKHEREGNVRLEFPLGHFKGLFFIIDYASSKKQLDKLSGLLCIRKFNPVEIFECFCKADSPLFVIRDRACEEILSILFKMPTGQRADFIALKFIEFMIYVSSLGAVRNTEPQLYFYREQIENIKRMHYHMVSNLNERFTISWLASHYKMSATSMKLCFRQIYGKPVDTYMREFRMHKACELLRDTDMSILEVAQRVGYESSSRFAAGFKKITGMSPTDYRKNV